MKYDRIFQQAAESTVARSRLPTPEEMEEIKRDGVEEFWARREPNGDATTENGDGCRRKVQNQAGKHPCVDVDTLEEFSEFPVEWLPDALRGFALAASRAIGCDVSFVAVPLLVVCAAAIGNSRVVRLKRGWMEPSVLWAAIIGESGGHKSPALEVVLRPLRDLQRKLLKEHEEAVKNHQTEMARHESALLAWKKSKSDTPPPEPPPEPIAHRILTDDATIEALGHLLSQNPRGMLLAKDELASWYASFGQYKGKSGGSDAPKYLEMHGARNIIIDRKTGTPRTLCIHRAALSVLGGIQPGTFERCMTPEHRESGLLPRMLLAMPPRTPRRWTEAEIDESAENALKELIERLLALQMEVDEEGELRPILVDLNPAAKSDFIQFVNEHGEEQASLTGDMAAAWSKLEGYAARLALVCHLVHQASGGKPKTNEISAWSMQSGIKLSQWFGNEAKRVHSMFSETEDQRELRELIEWIERRPTPPTARDLQRGNRRYRDAGAAAKAFDRLVAAGVGKAVPVNTEGRQRVEFHFLDDWKCRRRHKPETQLENGPSVDKETAFSLGERDLGDDEVDRLMGVFGDE